jgi:hypothetical protein
MGRYRRSALTVVGVVVAAAVGASGPAFAQAPAGTRVELQVLVVTDGGPNTAAIVQELAAEGVPYRQISLSDPNRPVIDAAFLSDTVTEGPATIQRAKYQAVVLPGASPFSNWAELDALHAYEVAFDIPEVDAYVWPDPNTGLAAPTYSGPLDGVTAALTPEAAASFGYLRGPVPFEDISPSVGETWGFLTSPLPPDPATGSVTTPLLTAAAPNGTAGNVLMAEHRGNGRRQLALTFSANSAQQQFRLLAPGIVAWATDGVHLGLHRNYLAVQVDDVFLGDSRWSTASNCTPEEDCPAGVTTPDIRMNASDVAAATTWQTEHDFKLDLAFNAGGSVEAIEESPSHTDALTTALLAQKDQFRWTNHTYSHDFLGCLRDNTVIPWRCETEPVSGDTRYVSQATINSEIAQNVAWANTKGLAINPSEVVTGEHSGLKILPQQPATNPHLGPALIANDISWLAADNSRMPVQTAVGSALTVPRYPLNVYYNVATEAEQVDEYNYIYTSRADGGSGVCEDNPATVTCITPLSTSTGFTDYIVPLETGFALSRMLGNDPRPHFVHQANITEGRILYPVLDSILSRYRSLLADNSPIVNPRLSESGVELKRQAQWADAIDDGGVHAYLQDGEVHITAPAGVDVPVTVPVGSLRGGTAFGDAYAGAQSAYATPAVDGTVTVVLP